VFVALGNIPTPAVKMAVLVVLILVLIMTILTRTSVVRAVFARRCPASAEGEMGECCMLRQPLLRHSDDVATSAPSHVFDRGTDGSVLLHGIVSPTVALSKSYHECFQHCSPAPFVNA